MTASQSPGLWIIASQHGRVHGSAATPQGAQARRAGRRFCATPLPAATPQHPCISASFGLPPKRPGRRRFARLSAKVRLEAIASLPGTDGSNPFPSSGESSELPTYIHGAAPDPLPCLRSLNGDRECFPLHDPPHAPGTVSNDADFAPAEIADHLSMMMEVRPGDGIAYLDAGCGVWTRASNRRTLRIAGLRASVRRRPSPADRLTECHRSGGGPYELRHTPGNICPSSGGPGCALTCGGSPSSIQPAAQNRGYWRRPNTSTVQLSWIA